MAYTTNQLISGAYYASGVASREFETVSGPEIGDGLEWLNNILTEKTVDDSMVSYESTYDFNLVIGQEKYTIENLIDVDTMVFYIDNVRFSMNKSKRDQYFGRARAENIEALPFMYYVEKQFEGADVYVYFLPYQAFPVQIHGTFRMSTVALGQDLSLTLDEFYTTYLRYALADRICAEYNLVTPINVIKQLTKYEEWISKKSKTLDLSLRKVSSLNKDKTGFDWQFANLYRGYFP
jgi:hypothetical protein